MRPASRSHCIASPAWGTVRAAQAPIHSTRSPPPKSGCAPEARLRRSLLPTRPLARPIALARSANTRSSRNTRAQAVPTTRRASPARRGNEVLPASFANPAGLERTSRNLVELSRTQQNLIVPCRSEMSPFVYVVGDRDQLAVAGSSHHNGKSVIPIAKGEQNGESKEPDSSRLSHGYPAADSRQRRG